MNNNCGFTLSEVLITLAIIGVISAISVPTLIQRTNDEQISVAVKETYAVLSQAVQRIEADGELRYTDNNTFRNTLANYMKVIQTGPADSINNGLRYYYYKNPTLVNNAAYCLDSTPAMRLANGSLISVCNVIPAGHTWGTGANSTTANVYMIVDVNGQKSPNMIGKDLVFFWINGSDVIPARDNDGWAQTCAPGAINVESSFACTSYHIMGKALP